VKSGGDTPYLHYRFGLSFWWSKFLMAVVTIDGKDIEVDDSERLNVIQAADRAGIPIPFYCWHPGLSVVASCRMCLV
jgi:predicted molibdopterin-dependent oxidoreductase YjgC